MSELIGFFVGGILGVFVATIALMPSGPDWGKPRDWIG